MALIVSLATVPSDMSPGSPIPGLQHLSAGQIVDRLPARQQGQRLRQPYQTDYPEVRVPALPAQMVSKVLKSLAWSWVLLIIQGATSCFEVTERALNTRG